MISNKSIFKISLYLISLFSLGSLTGIIVIRIISNELNLLYLMILILIALLCAKIESSLLNYINKFLKDENSKTSNS